MSGHAAKSGCEHCIMRGLGLCDVLAELGWEQVSSDQRQTVPQRKRLFAARRSIFRQNETLDGVLVICEGWAASVLRLSSGRRQILSFLLPGEIVSCGSLFESRLHFAIDAVTRGCCRLFDSTQLRAAIAASPAIFDRILSACNGEKNRADQLIADLGRRTAVERVARLLLDIWNRSERSAPKPEKRGPVTDNSVDFPLRQTHIADATGLTPVYVNKVLGELRKSGVAEISGRALQIFDMEKLRRLAA
jgi:CRP/FNR family transcriptional regulator